MGWLNRMFGGGKRQDKAAAVFEKLSDFLNSDAVQNAAMPDDIKAILSVGGAVDYLAGATGEFGRTATNPIPVNGPVGEVTYLSALTTADGRGVWAHRLGSRDRIDIFEVVSDDGKEWCLLYLAPYHPRKSKLVPKGFRFRDPPRVRGIFATNQHVPDFPLSLHEAIRDWSKATLGIPLVSSGLRSAIQSASFQRPAHHISDLEEIELHGQTSHEGDDVKSMILHEWTHNKLVKPLLSVLNHTLGYDELDVAEVLIFCASIMTYCYLRYGPSEPDHNMLDAYHRKVVEDIATGSKPFDDSLVLYQSRYQEYAALLKPVLDPDQDQRHHMTTLMMHVCERASHASAQGKMIKITISSQVIAALLDDTFKFARKQARLSSDSF